MKSSSKYEQLVLELRELLCSKCSFLYSSIIYGSFSRCEILSIFSDIDLLCIIKSDYLKTVEVDELQNIVSSLYNKYSIKIHLRIRNLSDLYTKESGYFDCGLTSSINKLRDGILLFGNSLDDIYLNYINSVKEDEYVENLKARLSDLKYQNRSLISMQSSYVNKSDFEDSLKYKCGCILFQLAELICYLYGIHFISSLDAIEKASKKTKFIFFEKALAIKQGNISVELSHFVSSIDEQILYYGNNILPENLIKLKRIKLHKMYNKDTKTDIFRDESIHYRYQLNAVDISFPYIKSVIITDGTLHIFIDIQK